MAETFTPELVFGPWQLGMLTDTGVNFRTIRRDETPPPAPTVPSAFTAPDWTATADDGLVAIGIVSLPSNGGASILHVDYRLNGGSRVNSGGTGNFNITGLTNGVSYAIELSAVNGVGRSAASDTKSRTPAAPSVLVTPTLSMNLTTQVLSVTNDGSQPVGTNYRWYDDQGNLVQTNGTSYTTVDGEAYYAVAYLGGDTSDPSELYAPSNAALLAEANFADYTDGTDLTAIVMAPASRQFIGGSGQYETLDGSLVRATNGTLYNRVDLSTPWQFVTTRIRADDGLIFDAALQPRTERYGYAGSDTPPGVQILYKSDQLQVGAFTAGFGTPTGADAYFVGNWGTGVTLQDGDTLSRGIYRAANGNDYFQILLNGSPVLTANGGLGHNVGNLMSLAVGNIFEFGQNSTPTVPPVTYIESNFWASQSNALSFQLVSYAFPTPTLDASANVTLNLRYSGAGTPTSFDVWFKDAETGLLLTTIQNVLAADLDTISAVVDQSLMSSPALMVDVRNHADSSVFATFYLGNMPFTYPITTPLIGHQASNMASWSPEGDIWTNRERVGGWRAYNDGTSTWYDIEDWTIDGFPTGVLPSGANCFVTKIWEGGMVGYQRGGTYTTTWEMTNVTAAWMSVSNATAGAIDNTAKTALLTVADFATPGAFLKFTPTGGATGNWRYTAVRNGETATGPINDKAMNDLVPGTICRWVKAQASEYPYPTWPTTPYLRSSPCAPPDVIGAASAQTDTYPHIVFSGNVNDDWLTEFAQSLKANIDPGRPVRFEYINEAWNLDYYASISYAVIVALNAGFVSGVTAGGNYQNYIVDDSVVQSWDGLVLQTIPSGTNFACRTNYHWVAMQATGTINPGDYIPDQQTPGWTGSNVIVRAGYDQIWPGKDIWRTKRVADIGDLFNTVFAGQNPILPVLGLFKGYSVEYIVQLLTAGGTGTEYGKRIKRVHSTHYVDLNYDWATAPGWLTNYADQTAFNAGLNAVSASGLTTLLDTLSYQMHGYYGALKNLGWADADIPLFGTYEGDLQHFVVNNVPSGDQSGLAAAMNAWRATASTYTNTLNGLTAVRNLGFHDMTNFGMNDYPKAEATIRIFGFQNAVNAWNSPSVGTDQRRMNAYLALTAL